MRNGRICCPTCVAGKEYGRWQIGIAVSMATSVHVLVKQFQHETNQSREQGYAGNDSSERGKIRRHDSHVCNGKTTDFDDTKSTNHLNSSRKREE